MIKAIVLYEQAPDAERYEQHAADFARKVPGATFRYGKIFAGPLGDNRYRHYAEFEWPDQESFQEGTRSGPHPPRTQAEEVQAACRWRK